MVAYHARSLFIHVSQTLSKSAGRPNMSLLRHRGGQCKCVVSGLCGVWHAQDILAQGQRRNYLVTGRWAP